MILLFLYLFGAFIAWDLTYLSVVPDLEWSDRAVMGSIISVALLCDSLTFHYVFFRNKDKDK